MRRSDREITDRARIDAILREAQVCRIALADEDGPYIVPMCFGYDGTALYLHSAPERTAGPPGSKVSSPAGSGSRKLAMIRKNPRCCFEVDQCDGIVKGERACSWGMRYRSVIGFGRAEIITNPAVKQHGLTSIMQQYHGGVHEYSEAELRSVTVIRITIESMTGKTS
jgi:nitroimidazol reductase NimA-like FMN-containing flavoprotein (pyridoxamine 5'-phosphate oxidase superfamily)